MTMWSCDGLKNRSRFTGDLDLDLAFCDVQDKSNSGLTIDVDDSRYVDLYIGPKLSTWRRSKSNSRALEISVCTHRIPVTTP